MYYRGSVKNKLEAPFIVQCTNCGSHNVDVIAFENNELEFKCKHCGSRLDVGMYNEKTYKEE